MKTDKELAELALLTTGINLEELSKEADIIAQEAIVKMKAFNIKSKRAREEFHAEFEALKRLNNPELDVDECAEAAGDLFKIGFNVAGFIELWWWSKKEDINIMDFIDG